MRTFNHLPMLVVSLLGLWAFSSSSQAEISQAPLGLVEGVPPNMILTLDESGSMSWGHVPDDNPWNGSAWPYDSRRYRAANLNSMYYNPNIIYQIPPAFDVNGTEYSLTTSFTNAPVNGFLPDGKQGKRNLSNEYRVVREFRMPDGTFRYADHPSGDFPTSSCTVTISSNNKTGSCSINNRSISVKRTNRGCDSVSPATVNLTIAGKTVPASTSCSRSSNTVTITATISSTSDLPAYYYEFDATLSNGNSSCAGKKNQADGGGENCYRLRWVDETSAYDENGNRLTHADGTSVDGRQNFAIWYSFYKTRALATLSAASIAFYDLSSDVRFTWQNLATCTNFNSTNSASNCGKNQLKPYNGAHRGEFYSWLRRVYFNTGTPLPAAMKRAGEYLTGEEPWKRYPHATNQADNTAANTYSCRASYHVLMTDGMWNDTTTNPDTFKSDNATWNTPQGSRYSTTAKSYSQIRPFYDSTSSTLADLAMHYWATDLRPNLDNSVPVHIPHIYEDKNKEFWDPRNNPAEWQHMTNFVMGLGLTRALNNPNVPWLGSTHEGEGYEKLVAGTASWPAASSDSANNVYDLWHAAINSRGEFYSVDSPEAMVQAFKTILIRIGERSSTASKPGFGAALELDATDGVNNQRMVTSLYRTTYDSTSWFGNVSMSTRYRQYNPTTRKFTYQTNEVWSAENKLPAHGARNIKIAGNSSQLQNFTTGNASAALQGYLNINPETGVADSRWQDRLNFLRGDKSKEGTGDNNFRQRSGILGDFFTSQPVLVSKARYLQGMANRLEPDANETYSAFRERIASRTPMLYVGGNAGMLHGFDAATGVEKFAFIPTAVFPNLNKLTGKAYQHHYYVDGTPVVADVFDGSKWRTILVGTLRAGGKGLFALDITDPTDISLLWELSESSVTQATDNKSLMGYSFAKPTVARLHNGKWAVVTGNGYESESGKAALLVINAVTGAVDKVLTAESTVNTTAPNGLSTPRLADFNGDGVADYAYAGDLHGNLWRFDLLGNSATGPSLAPPRPGTYGSKNDGDSNFAVSYGGEPMFQAVATGDATKYQPIMAAPSLVRHPNREGYLVIFGTGKYLENTDKDGDNSMAQTLYAIWDMKTKGENTRYSTDVIPRSKLQRQEITTQSTATTSAGLNQLARIISSNDVIWRDSSNNVNQRGWYLDLNVNSTNHFDGEMIVEDMQAIGDMIIFQTLVPNADPCAGGTGYWLYAINALTGGKTQNHVLDTRLTNNNVVSGIKTDTPGGIQLTPSEGPGTADPDGTDSSSFTWGVCDGKRLGVYCDNSNNFPPRQTWRIVPPKAPVVAAPEPEAEP